MSRNRNQSNRKGNFTGPSIELEALVTEATGTSMIAGIDEAGRGAIAGPVYAAAVILPLSEPNRLKLLKHVDDSKRKSPKQREELFELIVQNALAHGIGSASPETIDREGIISANAMAMTDAVANLNPPAQYLLLDGRMRLKNLVLPQESIIKGDQLSLSIAAASILAKVSRDRYMVSLSDRYPDYGLERNKGYCTPDHVATLDEIGPSPIHRHSFAPIRLALL